jgi:HlyD family secretion protein
MRRKKLITAVVAAALVAGGAAIAVHQVTSASAHEPPFRTAAVTRERISSVVTATGTLSPLKMVQVGSQVSGRVLELNADFNSQVKKGDVIARLEPQLLASEVERAEANLTSARANLVKAQAALADARLNATRSTALLERGVLPKADADTAVSAEKSARASVTAAAAAVEQAKAAVSQAKVNLGYTTIVSPIDGVVISRDVDVGQTVAASLSAPTLFTIAEDLRAMEVHTSVAESDLGVLADGMKVTFTVDAFPQERFRGVVSQIRNKATTTQNVVTYDAVVRVDNPELKLRPGMTANVTFVVAERSDALVVPSTALRFTPAGEAAPVRRGARRVWVLEAGVPRAVEVTTGITDNRRTEIVDGELAEGAQVIVAAAGAPAAGPAGNEGGAGGQPQRAGGGNGSGARRAMRGF